MRDLGAMLEQLVDEMIDKNLDYETAERVFQTCFIRRVLDGANGNVVKAADKLGMHRNTLARKIQELQIKASR